jgi:hypothetical protein
MSEGRKAPAGPERAIGAVVLAIGLAGLAVLAFAARKIFSLDRAVDPGDVAVLAVFAAFGAFCSLLGWRLVRLRGAPAAPGAAPAEPGGPPRRVTLSHGCAAAGVALVILSVLLPAHWYPVAFLFAGLALLAVSHGLTPCVERIEQLRKARASERQL